MTTDNGIVFHVDEAGADKHRSLIRNVENLIDELRDGAPVELVAHGNGLAIALSGSAVEPELRALLDGGVIVAACRNTMRAKGIEEDALIRGVTVVPAGVAELVRRQRAGWAYVKP